ncbi:MAG: hypothetical protein LIO77_01690, partial [Rikenellaceae bacterium]|nr:hypothetical protein [Rikenellaceae bacterium]
MKKMHGHSGHPAGTGKMPPAGRPHGGPAVMKDRFGKMPVHNPGLFTIRRLRSESSPTDSPSPPIRTGIHCFVFVEVGETLVS